MQVEGGDLAKLEKVLIVDGHVNRKFVGKNPSVILKEIGMRVSDDVRIAFAEVDESHPFVQLEMLLPVLGLVRVPDWEQAIEMALRVEHGFFHTATMHSMAIDRLDKMARAVNVSIFVKNLDDFATVNTVYASFLSEPYPARETVEVSRLPLDALVEISGIAMVEGNQAE